MCFAIQPGSVDVNPGSCRLARRLTPSLRLLLMWILALGAGSQARSATGSIDNQNPVQLPYATVSAADLGLPDELSSPAEVASPYEIPGRRVPETVAFADLVAPELVKRSIPLPAANTLAHRSYQARYFGRLQMPGGELQYFNPQSILVKFKGQRHVAALRVEPMREWEAVGLLRGQAEVQFAELDTFQKRQFIPNDPSLGSQWHHGIIRSAQAWDISLGSHAVKVAILDTPFQMNHPDVAANTAPGWDIVANAPITTFPVIVHSMFCAGMAAAVINNGVGMAGAGNCSVLPININGALSEMYNGTVWAADHGVRVVNISWSGANSDTVEAGALYLKSKGGILGMSALDGTGAANYTNQPNVYCISMTDREDNFNTTKFGSYIDFAAPGFQVFSTTTNAGYASGTGTSYATPLFCGMLAVLFSINPTLGPDEMIGVVRDTAVQLNGFTTKNPYYGWGRIDFAAAAQAAGNLLPAITSVKVVDQQLQLTAKFSPELSYSLLRSLALPGAVWLPVTNAVFSNDGAILTVVDPTASGEKSYYRLGITHP